MEWKKINGFEDYEISSCGLVKSVNRFVPVKKKNGKYKLKHISERILKPAISGTGYEFVCLRKNGRHHNKRIHQLVAEHFCTGYKKGLVVHHKDHDKCNNHFENLEYVSKQKNTRNYYRFIGKQCGTVPIGDIPKIIERVNNGEECAKIAKEYSITRNDLATLTKVITLTGEELIIKKK